MCLHFSGQRKNTWNKYECSYVYCNYCIFLCYYNTGWLIKNIPNFAMMLYYSPIEFKQKDITFLSAIVDEQYEKIQHYYAFVSTVKYVKKSIGCPQRNGWRFGLVVTRWPRSTQLRYVSTRMGDRLWTGKLSRYVTSQLGQLSLSSLRGRFDKSSTNLPGAGWGEGAAVTSVGWQITLCDLIDKWCPVVVR